MDHRETDMGVPSLSLFFFPPRTLVIPNNNHVSKPIRIWPQMSVVVGKKYRKHDTVNKGKIDSDDQIERIMVQSLPSLPDLLHPWRFHALSEYFDPHVSVQTQFPKFGNTLETNFEKVLKQSLNMDWSKCSRFSSKNDLSWVVPDSNQVHSAPRMV